jgi:TetR/AcrR family transcriptional regulator
MENNNIEEKIISVAREVFIEKGFEGASMSDIAARVGINRPTLHYYYRTKDKMFQAVFISIIHSFTPKIQDMVIKDNIPFENKIEKVIDIYLEVALNNPYLPLFIIREVNRNAKSFVEALRTIYIENFLNKVGTVLLHEMESGNIKQIPLRIVFNTFYGLMIFPFLSKDLLFMDSGKTLEDSIKEWKPYFVEQMKHLLCK